MKIVGIKKKVDNLGRIFIPKPMRDLYGLDDVVELVVTSEGVLLRSAYKEWLADTAESKKQ